MSQKIVSADIVFDESKYTKTRMPVKGEMGLKEVYVFENSCKNKKCAKPVWTLNSDNFDDPEKENGYFVCMDLLFGDCTERTLDEIQS